MIVKHVITDIEGTTTDIQFVHDVLFPFARKHLPQYLQEHHKKPEISVIIDEVKTTIGMHATLDEVIKQLLRWIDQDKKVTPLKTLQGYIWKIGYDSGELKTHIYDDVVPMLHLWHDQGIELGVFSSGSIEAQKLLFGHTEKGDLTSLFSHYFDTNTGPKQEVRSYISINKQLGVDEPRQVLFLSDVTAELDAAKAAGMQTAQLCRDGQQSGIHLVVKGFNRINLVQSHL